jgi:hypothetical protein
MPAKVQLQLHLAAISFGYPDHKMSFKRTIDKKICNPCICNMSDSEQTNLSVISKVITSQSKQKS